MPDLTPTDRALLEAWSKWWAFPGRRDSLLAEETGLSPARQALRLSQLIDTAEAQREYPITCRRLREVRARGQRSRRVRI